MNMKPYYEQDGITIYHGDCREMLPRLRCDAVLTDPPYGIGVCTRADGGGVCSASSGNKVYERADWDLSPPPSEVFASILSLDVPTVIWGGNYFPLPPTKCLLIWDKMQREFSLADAEVAWTNLDRAVRIYSYSRGQLTAEGKVHPTQKPVPLMAWCLQLMKLRSGAAVLDPFMGSGSTLRAAKDAGLRAIGIEKSERYCEVAVERLRQGVLFGASA